MRKSSKFLAVLLVVAMVLPGMAQAVQVEEKNVNRLSGDDRVLTAIAASKEVYKEVANSVVLAGFNGEVDALTGTLLAGEKDAPLLLTKRAELSPATEKELKRLNPKTVYILGGEKVVSKEVEAKLKKNYTVERVEGANRYETAVNVAEKVKGKTATHVFLALGREAVKGDALVDGLAIGPASIKEKMPVLLTEKDKLPKETKEALADLGVTDVTILGGPLAISEKVEKELKGYKLNRVKGANRYETALEIAKKYFGSPENVVLAYGWKSADALVGGYLGAKKDAPILLTNKDKLDDKTEKYIKDNSNKAYILGGTTVVSEDVFKKVEVAIATEDIVDITIDKATTLDKNYDTVKVTGDNIVVDLGGHTIKKLTITGNDTTIKNGKILNLNIEKDLVNVVLENVVDDEEDSKHYFDGGGANSIILKGYTRLNGIIYITSQTPIHIRTEDLDAEVGFTGKVVILTSAAVTIGAPVKELEDTKQNKSIIIEGEVGKVTALANVQIKVGKDVKAPELEKAKGVEASATDGDGNKQDFVENDKLKPTEPLPVDPVYPGPTAGDQARARLAGEVAKEVSSVDGGRNFLIEFSNKITTITILNEGKNEKITELSGTGAFVALAEIEEVRGYKIGGKREFYDGGGNRKDSGTLKGYIVADVLSKLGLNPGSILGDLIEETLTINVVGLDDGVNFTDIYTFKFVGE